MLLSIIIFKNTIKDETMKYVFSIEESFCKSEQAYYEMRKNLNMKQKQKTKKKRYNNKNHLWIRERYIY